jgi:uncharacterized protein (DUF2062 family)
MMDWVRSRLWSPLRELLRKGLTPEGLAWSLAVGLALGVIPLFGTSTALCVGAALAFRLNQPAMQLANYLAYPLQIILLIPFIRMGEWLFGAPPLPLSLTGLLAAMKADAWGTLGVFWTSLWHGAVAWLLVIPVPTLLLGWVLVRLFRAVQKPLRRFR